MDPIDSILVVSFGGPEGPDDVMPFLRNVTRGRNVPEERLLGVAEHYFHFGGRSPINEQARALIRALEDRLAVDGPDLPVYWGNRNWEPFLVDTVRRMRDDGRRHALAFVTSAYSSYSSCRQYREDIAGALKEASGDGLAIDLQIEKLRQFYNHPGFIEPMIDNTRDALDRLSPGELVDTQLVFTAHSIPLTMARTSRYEEQLREASRLVADRLGGQSRWALVFQSRSGSPHIPWLEPDVCDHLDALHEDGVRKAVLVPIGFISDHMEVAYDLDTEAMKKAAELGMEVTRAATVGDDPRFIETVRELILERLDVDRQRRALGFDGPVSCLGPECCPPPSAAAKLVSR